jgi:uncharacterized RDD family membrane protein YckC
MEKTRYHTGLNRIWAAIVDGIVFSPLILFELWLSKRNYNFSISTSWAIFSAFMPILYSIILHFKYGQTIGKWVAGVKVLDISEEKRITLIQAVIRESPYLVVQILGLLYFFFHLLRTANFQAFYSDYNDFVSVPIFWWTIIELISMLTNNKRRAIHDVLAKTVVIKTENLQPTSASCKPTS